MRCITSLKKACPELPIKTHIIVGFPSETERDFSHTIEFLKNCRFEEVLIYEYSERPNTVAAELSEKVPNKVKKSRCYRLVKFCQKEGMVALIG